MHPTKIDNEGTSSYSKKKIRNFPRRNLYIWLCYYIIDSHGGQVTYSCTAPPVHVILGTIQVIINQYLRTESNEKERQRDYAVLGSTQKPN